MWKTSKKATKKPSVDGYYCPHGHGQLEEWSEQVECSTCGWKPGGPLNYLFGQSKVTVGCFFIGLIPVVTSIYAGYRLTKVHEIDWKAEGDPGTMFVFIGAISIGGTAFFAIYGIVWILDKIWKKW